MTFTSELLLLLWVVGSILLNGIALLRSLAKLRGIDLVGSAAAAHCSRRAYLGWVTIQSLLNLGMLVAPGLTTGVRFQNH